MFSITGDFYTYSPKENQFRMSIKVESSEEVYRRLYEFIKSDIEIAIDYGEKIESSIDYMTIFARSIIIHFLLPLDADVLKFYNHSVFIELWARRGERTKKYAISNLLPVIRNNISKIMEFYEYEAEAEGEKVLIEEYKSVKKDYGIVSLDSLDYDEALRFNDFLVEKIFHENIGDANYNPDRKYLAECRQKKKCAICGGKQSNKVGIVPVCEKHMDEFVKGGRNYEAFKKKYKFEV